jgi:hypothetical protein
MHTISRQFLEETFLHCFTAEVSELAHGGQLAGRRGLPRKFSVPHLGNGNPFIAVEIDRNEDGLRAVKYQQLLGCGTAVFITIFND